MTHGLITSLLLGAVVYLLYRQIELKHDLAGRNNRDGDYVSALTGFVDTFEGYSGCHGRLMADECENLARRGGMPEETIFSLRMAALLHDCGELSLPKELLRANRRLSPEEWDLIKSHPLIGELMIREVVDPGDEVPCIVRWHHERWDGGGYPDRLQGEQIPPAARILALVDAVVAMSSARPFRPAYVADEIRQELKRMAGFQFDPAWVKLYLEILVEKPA
jgi:putative two-component system response regulator